ncbi:MAG: hypothetical protein K0S37_3654, partial [Microbacterium sp.]|nr:hypothetical protein [Microbacterium sp.]
PVAPIPSLPSQTNAALTGSKLADNTTIKTVQIWQAILATRPTGPVAPGPAPLVPAAKPITPLATLTRGAAGGPLVAAFTGGFAIGQGGLQLYGAVTGDDPLKNICGSGFEGIGSVMYFGMMPDCTVPIVKPNEDFPSSRELAYGGASWKYNSRTNFAGSTTGQAWCYVGPSASPAGTSLQLLRKGAQASTVWSTIIMQTGGQYCRGMVQYSLDLASAAGDPAPLRLVQTSTGSVVATETVTAPNPSRTPSCKVNWDDGTTTTGTGTAYKESEGVPISTEKLGCKSAWDAKPGAGDTALPEKISVDSDDGTGAKTQIADGNVPAMSPEQKKSLTADNGTGLVLSRVINGVDTSCNTWAADCANWWDTTGQGQNEGTGDQTYRCSFGGQKVSLSECGPYRHSFDQQTATPTITDPQTGEQVDWQAGTNPQNSTSPGSGPTPGEDCMQSWPSIANPIAWVLHPVKCALVWAFVPRPANVLAFQNGITGAWEGSALGETQIAIQGLGGLFNAGAGCAGLPFEFNAMGVEFKGRLFEACSEPWAGVATVVRNIVSGVIIVGGVMAIVRYGAGVFGYVGLGMGWGENDNVEKGPRFR